jgi:GT2 family glycosyltransferase
VGDAVYILLPVHNRRALTVRMAEALRRQNLSEFHVWLLDDGSGDGTADAVREILPAVKVIPGDGNWWWGGCLQQAWLLLKQTPPSPESIIGICNDDMEIEDDFLSNAAGELRRQPDTLLLAREIDPATGADLPTGVAVDLVNLRFAATRDPAAINCLSTRGLFLRWRDFERIGGFHPRLLPHYLSDYEFTLRAHRCGLQLRVAESFAIRLNHAASGLDRPQILRAPRWQRPQMVFSRRFKENPWAWSAFVWLAVPWWRRPRLWLKVWASTAVLLFGSLFASRI